MDFDPSSPPSTGDVTPESDLLVGESGPDLYRRNAFRITALPVDATMREVSRQADRLRMMEKLGAGIGSVAQGPLALDPPPGEDSMREAVQRLRDPERRLVDELFWFWPEASRSSAQDPALQALSRGETDEASRQWQERERAESEAATSTHNLAVLAHAVALDMEQQGVLEGDAGAQRDRCWREALAGWRELIRREEFWRRLTQRIRELDDPRLSTGAARRMRASLPLTVLLINARLAVAAAEAGRGEDADRHLALLEGSGFDEAVVDEALKRALEPIRKRIQSHGKSADEQVDRDPEEGYRLARRLMEQTAPLLKVLDAVLPERHAMRDGAHDQVATQALACQIAYGNKTQDWEICAQLLQDVLELPLGEALRNRVEKNLGIVRGNAEGSSFRGRGYSDLPDELRDKLDEAKEMTDRGLRTEAIALLVELGMGRAGVEVSPEHREHVDRGLAHCLLLRGVSGINEAVRKSNEPTSVLKQVAGRATGSDSVAFLMASFGQSQACMACGGAIQNQFAHFEWKGMRVILCITCHNKQQAEIEERKRQVKKAVEEASLDLGLGAELDPKNGGVQTQMEQLKKTASELGARIGNPLVQRLRLGYVTAAEAARHVETGGLGVRSAAMDVLRRLDPEKAREMSRMLWRRRGKRTAQIAAALLLLWLGSNVTGHLLHNPLGTQHLHALHLLTDRAALAGYSAALEKEDTKDPAGVVHAIRDIGGPEATRVLMSGLGSWTPEARLDAIYALGRQADPLAVPALLTALNGDDASLTLAAGGALGAIGDPSAVEPLVALLDPRAVPALLAALTGDHASRTLAAGGELGSIDRLSAVDPLVALLAPSASDSAQSDQAREVKIAAAVAALARIGDPRALEPILSLATDGEAPRMVVLAVLTMAAGGCRDAVEALAETDRGSAGSVARGVITLLEDVQVEAAASAGRILFPYITEPAHLAPGDPIDIFGDRGPTWGYFGLAGERIGVTLRPVSMRMEMRFIGPSAISGVYVAPAGTVTTVPYTLQEGGFHWIRVTGSRSQQGDFELTAGDAPDGGRVPSGPSMRTATSPTDRYTRSAVEEATQAGRVVGPSESQSGRLAATGERQTWALTGHAGQRVTIDLESSVFDAVLTVFAPTGATHTDDDSGNQQNARLTFTMESDQAHLIIVQSYRGSGRAGTYRLRVTDRGSAAAPTSRPSPTLTTPGRSPVPPATQQTQPAPTRQPPPARTAPSRPAARPATAMGPVTPARERSLASDESGIGRLAPGARETWKVRGIAGARFTVDVESPDFDTYLTVTGPGLNPLSDNARLTFVTPQTGEYTATVRGRNASSSGSYRVRVSATPARAEAPAAQEERPEPEPELPSLGPRELRVGMERSGELGAQGFQEWRFQGVAGTRVTVSLTSPDFDTNITVTGPGLPEPLKDDDGGSGTNSRLSFTVPESGTFVIRVGSFRDRGVGSFMLLIGG